MSSWNCPGGKPKIEPGRAGTGLGLGRMVGRAGAIAALLVVSTAIGSWAPVASATQTAPEYYLAVGGSASIGFQPTPSVLKGEPTDRGYADDLVSLEDARWPHLQVVHTGCPGETTQAMLKGGDSCYSPPSSQLD